MDRNFDKSLELVLKEEGGWSDHPNDKGGATMKGVTLATFRALVKPNATKEDLRKITTEQLGVVYRRHYWDKVLGAKLPGGIDYAVFDFAVNSGPSHAVKFLQRIVGTAQDGRIGQKTLEAVDAFDRVQLINSLMDARLAWLKSLKGKSGWQTFGKGWGARITRVRAAALCLPNEEKTVTKRVEVEVTKPTVPHSVDKEIKQKTNIGVSTLFGGGALASAGTWLASADRETIILTFVGGLIAGIVMLIAGRFIIQRIKTLRTEIES